jgi:hypothetical protein
MIVENVIDAMNRINENITISKLMYRTRTRSGDLRYR